MIIKTPRKSSPVGVPLLHEGHKRPVTRREFLGAGLVAGGAAVWTPNLLGLLLPKSAEAATTPTDCGINSAAGAGVPFICFDLGGGANMAGSNVLIGAAPNDQLAELSPAGYNKLGLPDSSIPRANSTFINSDFGLLFHADSAFVRGMMSRTSLEARLLVDGCVIPNRSDNDTGNNPHNPMYLIARAKLAAGQRAGLMELIGTDNSDSGGRSMAGTLFMDAELRPVRIAGRNDSVGLVDTGGLKEQMQLTTGELKAIAQTIAMLSGDKVDKSIPTSLGSNKLVNCAYHKATYNLTSFTKAQFDPLLDTAISAGLTARTYANNQSPETTARAGLAATDQIFSSDEITNRDTFRKTSAVMQMVINRNAGAGTIALGGYDYHDGTRATGERRDFEAGAAIGGCIEYAHRTGNPVMIYVFTDGSLASNGALDTSLDGRGKGQWTGDNSSTSASFMLVYNPGGKASMISRQLGYFRTSGSVETNMTTPGANNVDALAQMVALNYMALTTANPGGAFDTLFTNGTQKHSLGDLASINNSLAFASPLA